MIDDVIVLNEKKGIIVEDGPNAITGLQVFMDEQQTDEGIESYEVAGESAGTMLIWRPFLRRHSAEAPSS